MGMVDRNIRLVCLKDSIYTVILADLAACSFRHSVRLLATGVYLVLFLCNMRNQLRNWFCLLWAIIYSGDVNDR